jgi:uncharacterized protein (DUF433 family)
MDLVVTTNSKVMHGAPCFAGTRVAVRTLFDHLEAGYTFEELLEPFPSVRREQVVPLLEMMRADVERIALLA